MLRQIYQMKPNLNSLEVKDEEQPDFFVHSFFSQMMLVDHASEMSFRLSCIQVRTSKKLATVCNRILNY